MQTLDDIFARHDGRKGALLPILHDVQASAGYISDDAVCDIAKFLNLTRAEVHGVVSFYHDFKTKPHAKDAIKICRSEACKARGVEAIVSEVEAARLRIEIETVYCLGLCSVGPAAMLGDQVYAQLTSAKLADLMARL
jgi:formate dehydrogenase subunit gamma